MSVGVLGIAYAAAGALVAALIAVTRGLSVLDAVLTAVLWPIYAPVVLLGGAGGEASSAEAALAEALALATQSPLARALPGPDAARELLRRLREGTHRHDELAAVLARPELAPEQLDAHARALAARHASAAAASARQRAGAVRQLAALRDRYRATLDEIAELTAQLASQAELVRVQPDLAAASIDLICDLVARVDQLGELAELVDPMPPLEAAG